MPSPSPPLVNVTLSASLSQKRRTAARLGKREQMETFQFVQLPNSNTVNDSTAAGTAVSKEEVEQLRRKVTLLESKLEELQDTVRVQANLGYVTDNRCYRDIRIHNDRRR